MFTCGWFVSIYSDQRTATACSTTLQHPVSLYRTEGVIKQATQLWYVRVDVGDDDGQEGKRGCGGGSWQPTSNITALSTG